MINVHVNPCKLITVVLVYCAHSVHCPLPSPSPWTKVFIDGILSSSIEFYSRGSTLDSNEYFVQREGEGGDSVQIRTPEAVMETTPELLMTVLRNTVGAWDVCMHYILLMTTAGYLLFYNNTYCLYETRSIWSDKNNFFCKGRAW